ncbi:MAG: hypothetical protein COY66_00705 [Candidatus Kerfeldbacteria bacterium CG_4_10_14_0_8_um_filter_42_10]|uniref:Phosphoribosylformylglycinamidine cyclo-ligase n=1 Tax=Candidatus Kerfeldbacteria bacterium CG_4_10_14_0_8_um_filter_42_10 TaxID=2014248 RepID=A0A2M7RKD1_9BACT|nr:MAG: hypothetical protein COY66_00705 [Candidatus Kerfeldbacteria bacterium CG_4_10_14_0_8_um_filter_42_10]
MNSKYADAGVSLETAHALDQRLKQMLGTGIGLFSGSQLVDLSTYEHPVLVTTIQHATMQAGVNFKRSGAVVSESCVQRLRQINCNPLFFLDYFAGGKLDVDSVAACIEGMKQGCGEAMPLLGGETAEMPGVIVPGYYEVVGFAVGVGEARELYHPHSPDTFPFYPQLSGFKKPVLVASVDGVGTKTKVALMAEKHEGIGQDLTHHCGNDISVCGALPLFFLGYLGTSGSVDPLSDLLGNSLQQGCDSFQCQSLGLVSCSVRETYEAGQYDLLGLMVGVVEADAFLDGSNTAAGDVLLGIPSVGLHTNGYSLARQIFFTDLGWPADQLIAAGVSPEFARQWKIPADVTIGNELLKVHQPYGRAIQTLLQNCHPRAFAHITGGGVENIPRVIPSQFQAVIKESTWPQPFIFPLIEKLGNVPHEEMLRVFNRGIGLVVILPAAEAQRAIQALAAQGITSYQIGGIDTRASGEPAVTIYP